MEFKGRISSVLPARSGTSQRTGNEWKALPFVFEYFENPNDRWSDKVLLETFKPEEMEQIKVDAEVRIGFGHSIREWTNQRGETQVFNEVRMYKFERLNAKSGATTVPVVTPHESIVNSNNEPTPSVEKNSENDDLPF